MMVSTATRLVGAFVSMNIRYCYIAIIRSHGCTKYNYEQIGYLQMHYFENMSWFFNPKFRTYNLHSVCLDSLQVNHFLGTFCYFLVIHDSFLLDISQDISRWSPHPRKNNQKFTFGQSQRQKLEVGIVQKYVKGANKELLPSRLSDLRVCCCHCQVVGTCNWQVKAEMAKSRHWRSRQTYPRPYEGIAAGGPLSFPVAVTSYVFPVPVIWFGLVDLHSVRRSYCLAGSETVWLFAWFSRAVCMCRFGW